MGGGVFHDRVKAILFGAEKSALVHSFPNPFLSILNPRTEARNTSFAAVTARTARARHDDHRVGPTPRLVEDVLGKDGEVSKKGWLDTARLPSWSAKEVRDKCLGFLAGGTMTQTMFLKEFGESAGRYAKFSRAPNKVGPYKLNPVAP